MNIFILDYDIEKSAHDHCDQHVNKLIVEAAQILCTVLHTQELPAHYKATHANHPVTLWAGKDINNFIYVVDYAFYLNEEAKRRYKKNKDHLSWTVIENLTWPKLNDVERTEFARAMPEEFKKIPDTVEAYRQYYKSKTFATWRHTEVPSWYNISKGE